MRARLARQAQAFDAAFATADVNHDGGIAKREAAANAALLANFAAVDTDGNGSISKDELRAAMIAAQAAEAGAQEPHTGPHGPASITGCAPPKDTRIR